jgi:NAD(P)-dependent dehydrogenase (short-subunit alcohol dehydrogenase family)
MSDSPIVITGATSGIGRAAAMTLARQGRRLVMIARDSEKTRAAHADILGASPNGAVELVTADLASLAEVRVAAEAIRGRHPAISALINNAGISLTTLEVSPEGYDTVFAVNVLAPFVLTSVLAPALKADGQGRVVMVSSDFRRPIDFASIEGQGFDATRAYAQSKLAVLMMSLEYARRLEPQGITVNCLAPGFIRSDIGRRFTGGLKLFWTFASMVMMEPAERGGDRVVDAAINPEWAGRTGLYFVKAKPVAIPPEAQNEAVSERLWTVCETALARAGVSAASG